MTIGRSRGSALALVLVLAAALGVVAPSLAIAAPATGAFKPPTLVGHVVDAAGALTSDQRVYVENRLEQVSGTSRYVVAALLVRSLGDETIEDVAYTTFNTWQVGEAGKDNGVLLVVAVDDHRVRIETGKGAGGVVPDLASNQILTKMAPLLASGRTYDAVMLAIDQLEPLLLKDGPRLLPPPSSEVSLALIIGFVVALVFAIAFVFSPAVRRGSRGAFYPLWILVRVLAAIADMMSGRGGRGGRGGPSAGGGGRSGGGGSSASF